MRKKISIFSFFSGIGILDLAFEKNGYTIVFVNEYDNLFMESYQYAREQMNRYMDIIMIVRNVMQNDVEKEISLVLSHGNTKKETWLVLLVAPHVQIFQSQGKMLVSMAKMAD